MLTEPNHYARNTEVKYGSQMQVKLTIEIETDLENIRDGLLGLLEKEVGQTKVATTVKEVVPAKNMRQVQSNWKEMPSLVAPTSSRGKTAYGFMRDGQGYPINNPEEQQWLKAMWNMKMNLGFTQWSSIARKLNEDGALRRNGTKWDGIAVRNIFRKAFE